MPGLIRAFVQARMSSRRFPGKVLAPFRGRPLIDHVLASVGQALPHVPIVVATSSEKTDDPLAEYLRSMNVPVFRGPLQKTFDRFRMCVREYPCEWILRVSGDSPMLDARVLKAVVRQAGAQWDLVTTISPRTFPSGQNAELIRVSTFVKIDAKEISDHDQEHVTSFYYRNTNQFRIFNVESGNAKLAELSFAVDTVEDLDRLERLSPQELRKLFPSHSKREIKVDPTCRR